jgi:hypothetical protein
MRIGSAAPAHSSGERLEKFIKEVDTATLRCRTCHRIKSILCGDCKVLIYIHPDASDLISWENKSSDPGLIITTEDGAEALFY